MNVSRRGMISRLHEDGRVEFTEVGLQDLPSSMESNQHVSVHEELVSYSSHVPGLKPEIHSSMELGHLRSLEPA